MKNRNVKICGTGRFLPGNAVAFDDVERYLGKISEAPFAVAKWFTRIKPLMKEMLDIDYYHFAIDPDTREFFEDNVSMSVKAAKEALNHAGLIPENIQFIAYGSAHQHQMPTASVRIQEALGITSCSEISIHANCTSAYKAFLVAYEFIKSGRYDNALVISSGISSSELIAEYYNQPLIKKEELFLRYFLCDGAGALVLQNTPEKSGLIVENAYIESIGGNKPAAMLNRRPAYWQNPKKEFETGAHHLAQMFNEQLRLHFHDVDGSVFYKGLRRMMEKYDIDATSVKYFQVNFPSKHIAELIMDECESLGIKREALYTKMNDMGYVGPPMVFICLDKIIREEKLSENDIILSFVTEVSKFMQAGFTLRYY
ncbi:MAG: 3-oxoacyl-ACP synthase III family protein [Bacteroidales bacterium]|jgi:3-oxoacyl-[acyl-carrier-protein] synthase III|nr:3-oxoacyl-ACP synthase III family protein [Bacteroidales bacterium]MDD4213908.1 3-oxoacyl-ACP synthase III family protein [Bacteroidales bacterium]